MSDTRQAAGRRARAAASRWAGGLAGALAALPSAAYAHPAAEGGGFAAGFFHPILGLDHVLAMLAVGMWGGQLGAPAIWVLPVAFPLIMALGGVLAIVGVPLPAGEIGIALSVVVLGAMIAFNRRVALWLALALISAFAVFHGHAHGLELPAHSDPVAYSAGFVLATGLIHLVGILFGLVIAMPGGMHVLRSGGAAIALVGAYLCGRLLFA